MGNEPLSEFDNAFIERTKDARESAGLTQDAIAMILGIKQDRYKQYETRTKLPHEFIPAFCAATHRPMEWLFTGRIARRRVPPPKAA